MAEPSERFEVTPSATNHFAWLRTRMAVDRTFMAWLRTAASMIGFGFTIVEFFAKFSQLEGVSRAKAPHAPRMLGLMLIGAGVVALAMALGQYRQVTKHLNSPQFAAIADEHTPVSASIMVAVALLLIGLFAFVSIILREH